MDENVTVNSVKLDEKTPEEKLEEQRAKKRVIQKRWRKRSKLKIRLAEIIRRFHLVNARNLSSKEISVINRELHKAVHLPYCWNDVDLARANAALTAFERKYLDRGYVGPSEDEVNVTAFIKNTLDDANLTKAQKVNVALNVFKEMGRDFVMEAGDGIDPSPDAALVLLTQDIGGTFPKWLAGSLADLLEMHFTRGDTKRFLTNLGIVLRKRDEKKYAAIDSARWKEEEDARIEAETLKK